METVSRFLSLTSKVEPGRPRLKTADARAITEFLNRGGRIAKVKGPVTATVQEVIDFLSTCGIEAKYLEGDMKGYWCKKRRCNATELVRLANTYRCAQLLAPFAMRQVPSPRKPASASRPLLT